ncbi:hypothetical protein B6R96_36335 (plasmid) [Streptomyces sp. Sge12]|uniref:hypothetical protein n=1 Tax=Streptomyces sp. Sge12 TaxID=1972846 RepID=UPI0009C374C7|nr:hypothetical protein [Streptomyces sp. Sge12]ARE79520.1 hypothetical protein B6R96_36335 [Streptomyces sp. Sge12]
MPNTAWTIAVAAVTAVVAATATGLTVTPRLDARKKRIGDAHAARDAFNTHLTTVLMASTRLRNFPLPAADDPACTPVVRERLAAERERWLQQIDEATQWMNDHVATFAGGWPSRHLIDLAVAYSSHARMLILSEREETTKLDLLGDLTLPVQRQFFGFWWTRLRHFHADHRKFTETVERLTEQPAAA